MRAGEGSLPGLIQFRLGCYDDFVCFIAFVYDSSVQVLSFVKGFQYSFYTAEGNARRRTNSVTTLNTRVLSKRLKFSGLPITRRVERSQCWIVVLQGSIRVDDYQLLGPRGLRVLAYLGSCGVPGIRL